MPGSLLESMGGSVLASAEANGVSPGGFAVLYFTGEGQLDNPVSAGSAAPAQPLARTLGKTEVTIGGISCQVAYSGLTPGFVGLAQANVEVPKLPPGDYSVVLKVADVAAKEGAITIR